jgi:hypothetical protein
MTLYLLLRSFGVEWDGRMIMYDELKRIREEPVANLKALSWHSPGRNEEKPQSGLPVMRRRVKNSIAWSILHGTTILRAAWS